MGSETSSAKYIAVSKSFNRTQFHIGYGSSSDGSYNWVAVEYALSSRLTLLAEHSFESNANGAIGAYWSLKANLEIVTAVSIVGVRRFYPNLS